MIEELSPVDKVSDALSYFAAYGDGNFANYPDSGGKKVIQAAIKVYRGRVSHPAEDKGEEVTLGFRHAPGSKATSEVIFNLSHPREGVLCKGSADAMAVILLVSDATSGDLASETTTEEGGGEEEITEQGIANTMPPPAGE